jgi:hypothetical protein
VVAARALERVLQVPGGEAVVGTWRWSVRPGGVEAADVEEGGLSLGSGTPESVVVPAFEGQVHGVDGQLAPRCGQDREDVPLPVERIGGTNCAEVPDGYLAP